ncbi:MAG: hypothetical protein KGQ61_02770 [Planctomycetes bacterium]|nr:hypothetical protein [Planctomycetota bacterium]
MKPPRRSLPWLVLGLALAASAVRGADDAAVSDEPQPSGWPLTAAERAYVLEPEYERRPGRSAGKHLPHLWPRVPSAGFWGGSAWLEAHEALVATVEAKRGPVDVLLVGDSITIQWGDSWRRNFPDLEAVNIGIGGDKTQNVLWRLDHGGVDGLEPRAIVLMIGNNNMFFTPETGIEAAAEGIATCARRLRERFPAAGLVVVKILPAHAPGDRFHDDIRRTNAALDDLRLERLPRVRVLDLTADFTNADGTIRKALFAPDAIHLTPAGYAAYAARLRPVLTALLDEPGR